MIFREFYNRLLLKGLETFGLFYGSYEGKIVDNQDPEKRGRLKVICPAIFGTVVPDKWILPKGVPAGNGFGIYFMPKKNDMVYLTFKGGNPRFPRWEYGWWIKGAGPANVSEKVYAIVTPAGYRLEFNEDSKEISLIRSDNQVMKFATKFSLNYNGVSQKEIESNLVQTLIESVVQTTGGPGGFSPNTITKLTEILTKINQMKE